MCDASQNYFLFEQMCCLGITVMAASRFSSDVLEMFYRSISHKEKQRLRLPIKPRRGFDFELARNNFD